MPIEAGCPVPAPQLSGLYGARPLASPLEETVLEAAPVAIALVTGPEFRFVYANRTLEALKPSVGMVGRTVAEVFPETYPVTGPLLRRVWARGLPFEAADIRAAVASARGTPPEARYFTWTCTPVMGARRRVEGILVVVADTTSRVRAESRHALFAQMLAELSAGADVKSLIRVALTRATELLGGDDGALFLLEQGGRVLRGVLETSPAGRTGLVIDVAAWPGVARAIAARRARFLLPGTAALALPEAWRRLGATGAIVAPLVVEERCLGVLVVSHGRPEWHAGADDLAFAGTIALQCGLAVDRARAYESERAARKRLQRVNGLTAALATARSVEEVVAATLQHGIAAFGACCGALSLAPERADAERAVHFVGERSACDPALPIDEAYRTHAPVFVGSPEALAERYPGAVMPAGAKAWAGLPLVVEDRCLGVVGLAFGAPHPFVAEERDGMLALAQKCAQALERAELDEALRRERAQLQGILEEQRAVERALRAATAALEDAGRHKDEFLAMLAHELRNPLAAIRNATHVLRLKLADGKPADRPIEILERQVANSTRILDDLLDVSRMTRGLVQLRREPVVLAQVVSSAIESQRALVEKLRHRLEVSVPAATLAVFGDPTRLEQIVANLVNNAAKYTPEGGRIGVALAEEAGTAVLTVVDDGAGISPELLPRIFDLFVQGDTTLAHTKGGLGLGLTLVKRLVALHGGTIVARSGGAGRGSTFEVRLPLAAERPALAAGEEPAPIAATRRRVLVVEDNADAAETLLDVVTAMGHEVHWARDGSAALAMTPRLAPDVVLLDIGLPGIDGYEVARRLRATSTPSALVALTGYGQEEDRARALDAGFDRHLTKPVEPAVLARVLSDVAAP